MTSTSSLFIFSDALIYIGITCPDLDDPKYGSVKVGGNTPGSKADYKCDDGFKLVGVAWRRCQDNGQWSGKAPTCMSKK